MKHFNTFGQEIGRPLPEWAPRSWPPRNTLPGRFCRMEPLEPARHAADLIAANALDPDGRMWTYLPYGPFESTAAYVSWLESMGRSRDPWMYAIVDIGTGQATGLAGYLRIEPALGSIEVGHLNYSPRLQRTPAATEAMFLLMRQAFDLGYRRYEWKCDSLNEPSRAAALRLGFTFEGIFRQATVVKRRNRDTAWFSILDGEWPALRGEFERWLSPDNFGPDGGQLTRLDARGRGGLSAGEV